MFCSMNHVNCERMLISVLDSFNCFPGELGESCKSLEIKFGRKNLASYQGGASRLQLSIGVGHRASPPKNSHGRKNQKFGGDPSSFRSITPATAASGQPTSRLFRNPNSTTPNYFFRSGHIVSFCQQAISQFFGNGKDITTRCPSQREQRSTT